MTTNELITALQLADPSGKLKVVVMETAERYVSPFSEPGTRDINAYFISKCGNSTGITDSDIGNKVVII